MAMVVYDFYLKTIGGTTEGFGPEKVTLQLIPPNNIRPEQFIRTCFNTDHYVRGYRLERKFIPASGNTRTHDYVASQYKWVFREGECRLYESAVAFYEPNEDREWERQG